MALAVHTGCPWISRPSIFQTLIPPSGVVVDVVIIRIPVWRIYINRI